MPSNDREIIAVDLFCGAGGFSEALHQACDELGYGLRHAAINHWEPAIETHETNHPDAHQYHSKVEQLHPPEVIDRLVDEDVADVHDSDVDVDLLVAGPECTHFSTARGDKPVNEQKRMSPWSVLDWLEKLDVEAFIIENVGEIQSWGPVEDGQPSRDGTVFDAWINALNQLGYSVDWTTLTAADFGDPTSRERFFLIGRQGGSVTFPEPTHDDADQDKPDRRTAAEIIDWSDTGSSIWTRDLTENRVHTPPKNTTMQRIAEGIRRHCADVLEPFADALDRMGNGNEDEPVPYRIQDLREQRVVPVKYADVVADAVDEPFLVRVPEHRTQRTPYLLGQHSNSVARDVRDRPTPTVATGGKLQLCTADSYLLRQQDGGNPWTVRDRPVPTIPKKGAHALVTPLPTLVKPKNGPKRGIHSNSLYEPDSQPFHTVTSDPRAKLVSPSLLRWSHGGATLDLEKPMPTIATERGGVFSLSSPVVRPFIDDYEGPAAPVDTPLGTLTSRDRFALCVPELWPWGLDIKYRMLQPQELKQAQGFPEDYEITGTKADRTEQIGNAVPVHLAKSLCKHVLTAEDPSLASYGGGITGEAEGEIRDYDEVVSDD